MNHDERHLTPAEEAAMEDKYEPTQREEHTARTIEAIGIIKDAFKQIDKMQMLINDRDLKIQELQNQLLMARSRQKQ